MKLVNLITYFRRGGTFEDFCDAHGLDPESEVIEIYAQVPTSLDAQLGFFTIEQTKGQVEYSKDGIKYQNLFDFFYFLDAIEEVKRMNDIDDDALSRKLFSYAVKDS